MERNKKGLSKTQPLISLLLACVVAGCGGGGGGAPSFAIPITETTGIAAPPPVPNLEVPPTDETASLPPLPEDQPFVNTKAYSLADNGNVAEHDEGTAVTHHRIKIAGKQRTYTAKAGHLLVRNESSSQPSAAIFYTAYTLDGESLGKRPVTFFFNGGPGSASSYLKMGSFAPKRVFTLNSSEVTGPNDLRFGENPETLLDRSDLIFVDPVGTGHSIAIAPSVNRDFWGVDADAASLSAFVQRYLNVNDRRLSPVFLFGESYGGPRISIMSYRLHANFSVKLSGLILLAPAMNYYEPVDPDKPREFNGLPTLAVTAHHFGLLNAEMQAKSVDEIYQEAANYANGPLLDFFQKTNPTASEVNAIKERLALFKVPELAMSESYVAQLVAMGLGPDEVAQMAFSMFMLGTEPTFFSLALMPPKILGYYDLRKTSNIAATKLIGDYLVYDPSVNDLDGYNAVHDSYMYHELKYQATSSYWTIMSGADISNKWVKKTLYPDGKTREYPDATVHLSAEMLNNSSMKVIALSGYYDGVVLANKVDRDMATMTQVPKEQMDRNYSVKRFEGGHMMYSDDKARVEIRKTLEGFYQSATQSAVP